MDTEHILTSKTMRSFEDNNVGIDFCFDPKTNRFLIVLSKENVIKTFEIKESKANRL